MEPEWGKQFGWVTPSSCLAPPADVAALRVPPRIPLNWLLGHESCGEGGIGQGL